MGRGPTARELVEEESNPLVKLPNVGVQFRVAGGKEGAGEHGWAEASAAVARARRGVRSRPGAGTRAGLGRVLGVRARSNRPGVGAGLGRGPGRPRGSRTRAWGGRSGDSDDEARVGPSGWNVPSPCRNQRAGRRDRVARRGTVGRGRRRGAGVRTRGSRSGAAVSRPGHGGESGRRVDPRGEWKRAGFQGGEARVGRPESASLGIHEACEAGREPFQVDQARLVVQALGLGQGGSRGGLGDRGRGERSGSSGAVQEQAIRPDRGPVLGLSEGRLCGRYECGQLAGEGGGGVEDREGGEGGEY
jgi:hypothetical protein